MLAIMADHDIEGQMQVLLHLLISREWSELWEELAMSVESFATLGVLLTFQMLRCGSTVKRSKSYF